MGATGQEWLVEDPGCAKALRRERHLVLEEEKGTEGHATRGKGGSDQNLRMPYQPGGGRRADAGGARTWFFLTFLTRATHPRREGLGNPA